MDIFEAGYMLSDLISEFTDFIFGSIVEFFSFSYDGILSYWPFFFAFLIFVAFGAVWGIVRLFNSL